MEIIDHRGEQPPTYWLYEAGAAVYEFCSETDRTVEAAWRNLRDQTGRGELEEVETALKRFCDLGIMIQEDGHYLSLAQPMNRNWFADREHSKSQSAEPTPSRSAA